MTTTQPVEPGQIRIGHAEREQMAERLAGAHAAGRLELDEFDERVKRTYEARVQTDLDALVADLPDEHSGRSGRSEGPGPGSMPPWVAGGGGHWRGGPAHWCGAAARRRNGAPQAVWVALAVVFALWVVGPVLGFLFHVVFNLLFAVLVVVGAVVLVRRIRSRRR